MHTDEALWHEVMERLADSAVTFIDAPARAAARAPSSCSTRGPARSPRRDYERFVLPHSRRVFAELADRHPRRPASTSGSAATTCSSRCTPPGRAVIGLDWRTPIADARRRLGADVVVQGNLDPALVLAGADARSPAPTPVLADNGGHPGHIFNLGHGVHPDTDPGVLRARSSTSSTSGRRRLTLTALTPRSACVLMAYGTPALDRTRSSRTTPTSAAAARRPPSSSPTSPRRYEAIGGLSPLAERTEAQRDALQRALDALAPGTYTVALGLKHADPKIEAAVDELAGRRRRARSSGWCSRRTTRRCRSASTSTGSTRRRRAARHRRRRRSRAGPPSRRTSTSSPPRCGAGSATMPPNTQGRVHRPLAAGADHRRRRPVPRRAARDRRGGRRRGSGSAEGAWAIAWQSAGPHARAVDRPDILAVIDDLGADRSGRRRARVRVRLRRRPPRGALRPRHRGPPAGRVARPGVRPHGVRERRSGGDGGARRLAIARARRALMPA